MSKTKAICKWDKSDYKDSISTLKKLVSNATYACMKCGRAANDKKVLCKPESL